MFFSAGLIWTSFLNLDPARELFTEDIETDDAYGKPADGCGVSRSAEVSENVVPLCADRLGGEKGVTLYLPEEAFELTDSVRLLEEAGLMRFSRACFTLSSVLDSNGVRRRLDSRISGASCRRRGEDVRRPSSDTCDRELEGMCCTFATIVGLSTSYC